MRKKYKKDFFICFIIAILNVVFVGFCINEYFCDKYAIVEPKIVIADELNIKYANKKELNKELKVFVVNYSSLVYEDIRVIYNGEVIYKKLGSDINPEQENETYWKFVNSVDEYLKKEESKTFFKIFIIYFGKLFVLLIMTVLGILAILILAVIAIYFLACYFAKRKVSMAEYCRALMFALKQT